MKNIFRSLELFAGGGGLALGAHQAGFRSVNAVEWEKNSCKTLRLNAHALFGNESERVIEADVRQFDESRIPKDIDALFGGPPCQPFSIGGHKKGFYDARDLFPEYLRILQSTRPKVFLIENVKGLTAKRFEEYLDFIFLQLSYIDYTPKKNATWEQQYKRLQGLHGKSELVNYRVSKKVLNAVDFGVPQYRERLFLIGFREDLNVEWAWPSATHSEDALIYSKYVDGSYFDRHKIKAEPIPEALAERVGRLKRIGKSSTHPHKTVRDALLGLPEPTNGKPHDIFLNHIGIPGARSYHGHTGSPYDSPAKTLKAGVHGCPGGENMLAYPNGSVRYFSVRESARLQTFPDNYGFFGSRSECMRQIGNAVPVELARVLSAKMKETVLSHGRSKKVQDRTSPSVLEAAQLSLM